jgi:ASC-1-like (ASCH) protein
MARWLLRVSSYQKRDDIFNLVGSGEKTIETRPNNPLKKRNYSKVKAGDILIFYSLASGKKIEKTATFTHVYESVEEMVKNEPVNKIFPGIKTPENLLGVYEEVKKKWGKNYAHKLEKYGIVAIGIK